MRNWRQRGETSMLGWRSLGGRFATHFGIESGILGSVFENEI